MLSPLSPLANGLSLFLLLFPLVAGCTESDPRDASADGADGENTACLWAPTPLFHLTITAAPVPVPSDTRIEVFWSAAAEPPFVFNDPSTWKTSDEANIVCDVDRKTPPPKALSALSCHLWTTGATQINVRAEGFSPIERTLLPKMSEHCQKPLPSNVGILLEPEERER